MTNAQPRRALFLFPTDVMGGAENVTRLVAGAALRSNTYDEVICFVLCKPSSGSLDKLAEDPRVRLIYTGAGSEKGGLLGLARVLASEKYALVFSSHTHLNAAASLMRKLHLLRTERLVTRESTMIFEREMGHRGTIARQLYKFYGAQDLIVCQTQRMAQSLNNNTASRFAPLISHIPNPVDLQTIALARQIPDDFLQSIPRDVPKIAWCGRLAAVKSPLRAVDALDELHKTGYPTARLIMIGDGPMRHEIEHHAKEKGLSDYLLLTGRIAAPSAIMQHCDVGLMTSDTEGFPNVILEMLASGLKRVVTTDCAGGLDDIPGVSVSAEKTAISLAVQLNRALKIKRKSEQVTSYLSKLDPQHFFDRLLKA